MGSALRGLLAAAAVLSGSLPVAAQQRVTLEETYYYDGNISANYLAPSIAVSADGTVAIAVNSTVGPGNTRNVHRRMVLLFDKTGEPIGRIQPDNTVMRRVCFGADGRIYTAEEWHGAGTHIYDRTGAKPREVPQRVLKADGSDVLSGGPLSVGVGPDYRVYTVSPKRELCITSPEAKLLKKLPGSGHDAIIVAPDGTVYSGDKILKEDDTWKQWDYWVRAVSANGKLLVSKGNEWGIYDPARRLMEKPVALPPGNWADPALGPDGNVYLVPNNIVAAPHVSLETPPGTDAGLAYVVADAEGKVLLRRGADFDRLRATLPKGELKAASTVVIEAETIRSRDSGYVPKSSQLPRDNRPPLQLTAALLPLVHDLLTPPAWQPVPLTADDKGKYKLTFPPELAGSFALQLAATPPKIPGVRPLAVQSTVTLIPEGAKAYVDPATDRNRTGFMAGQAIRLTVPMAAPADLNVRDAKLVLCLGERVVWECPLGLGDLAAGSNRTAVVTVPVTVTARLRPGVYAAKVVGLPPMIVSGSAVVAIVDPVRPTDCVTVLHGLGNYASSYQDSVRDAKLYADMGFTHVVSPEKWDGTFLDTLTRLGLTFHLQPYGHFYPVELLPQEHGAARQQIAELAQRMLPYSSFRGFNYHDGINNPKWPYGWFTGGAQERAKHDALMAEAIKLVKVPSTVPANQRETYARNVVNSSMPSGLYTALAQAIERVDGRLDRTTMQWWQAPLWLADPDRVTERQTIISTQHMEEQYYHPVIVANQADLWRQPGKPLWVYGNNSFQDDGTGAAFHTDFMAALSRGVQGVGRTGNMPTVGNIGTEVTDRAATPALRLIKVYGGLSAVALPADLVAVWRSSYQEASVPLNAAWDRWHLFNTMAAYTACLYAHRTATILTDDRVRAGELKNYQAVVVSFEIPLPPDLAVRLKEFQDGGGLVLANRPADGYWAPPGAVELGSAFGRSHADWFANRDSERHIGIEEDGRKGTAMLRKALGNRAIPLADCDDPTTWLSILKHGRARYVYAVNVKRLPQDPMDLHRYSGYENTRLPTKTKLELLSGDFAVYDVFSGKQVSPLKKDNGSWEVEADLSVFPGAMFALLPAAIDRLRLSSGQGAEGSGLRVQVQIADAEGKTIDGAIPLEVVIEDASGGRRYHLYRTAMHGAWDETLPVASNDVPGRWRIIVTERLSGREVSGKIPVTVPALPAAKPTPAVEWTRQENIAEALHRARHVALDVEDKQAAPFAAAIKSVHEWLQKQGKEVEQVSAKDYLADRQKYQWEKFKFGSQNRADVQLRPRKYDLVMTFDTPDASSGIFSPDLLPIVTSSADPGPGRGLVQYAVMPVYDTEDAVALAGGDLAGLLAAAKSLASPPEPGSAVRRADVPLTPVDAAARTSRQAGLREFIGIPVGELAATPDGQRIAAGLKGWGNNFFVLDADGKVIGKDTCGKLFPVNLRALNDGFTVVAHENDPTTLYLMLYGRDGKPKARLASAGRRVGGMRDWSPSVPSPDVMLPFLQQASFSVTLDGRFAAVGGSKAIAVWDVTAGKLLWRDDSVHYTAPGPQNVSTGPLEMAPSFPQLKLSPDGAALILHHNGITTLRDGRTGERGQELPAAGAGPVQVFDGRALVLGNPNSARSPFSEFTGCRDGARLWKWQAPRPVTAIAFAGDGLRYAVGEVDGTLRLMEGAGQVAGWVSPDGAVCSLSVDAAGDRVAFATTGGWVGSMDFGGRILWQKNLGARAVIQFLGAKGDTVVGDWRGIVRRFGLDGNEVWGVDLTPQVWREDLATLLTATDRVPTLRLPPPDSPKVAVPDGARNLAPSASVRFLRPKAWVGDDWSPIREVSVNDGKKVSPPGGWFNRPTVEYAAFVPSPPAWELEWKQPVTLNTIVIYESKDHPDAVPEEVRIEAWVGGTWKVVRHEFWNTGVVHAHRFDTVTTTKLRYMPLGDLAKNIWLSEIEAFNVEH